MVSIDLHIKRTCNASFSSSFFFSYLFDRSSSFCIAETSLHNAQLPFVQLSKIETRKKVYETYEIEWRKIRLLAKFMSRDLNRNRTKQKRKKEEKRTFCWKQICSLHCTCSFSRTIGWNGNVSEQNCWCWSTLESTP